MSTLFGGDEFDSARIGRFIKEDPETAAKVYAELTSVIQNRLMTVGEYEYLIQEGVEDTDEVNQRLKDFQAVFHSYGFRHP